ncbi:MAG: hypothetical protein ACKOZY_03625 [Flavobacteriales bacterium]
MRLPWLGILVLLLLDVRIARSQQWTLGAEYGYGGAWNIDASNTRKARPDDCLLAQAVTELWPSSGNFGFRIGLGWSETNTSFMTDAAYAGIPTTLTYSSSALTSRLHVLIRANKNVAWGIGILPQWMYREAFGLYSKVDPNAVVVSIDNAEDWRRWNAGISAICRMRWSRIGITTFFLNYQTLPLYRNNAQTWTSEGVNFRHVTAGASIGLDFLRR